MFLLYISDLHVHICTLYYSIRMVDVLLPLFSTYISDAFRHRIAFSIASQLKSRLDSFSLKKLLPLSHLKS